ncbi:penicillin-binding protein 2 [Formicincola oecophyllae]|uniref:Penicillin-binding protein 2 n=1 Tax=Formicincola oecophyllae TaxID=2558361 RepID=A0A4Y6U756_9PROT|nr:penicillin-binding protein 2 [Formicincola oecophyllae]QDH13004.1 penicillin-binding protein 2 [Formicincola oecophyllae]
MTERPPHPPTPLPPWAGPDPYQPAPFQGTGAPPPNSATLFAGVQLSQWLQRAHTRLLFVCCGFGVLYLALATKAFMATVGHPLAPQPNQLRQQVPAIPHSDPTGALSDVLTMPHVHRATITDRNGQALALSLPVAQLYANPQEIDAAADADDVARRVHAILPDSTRLPDLQRHLRDTKKRFAYLARNISLAQEKAINDLGVPGLYFEEGEQRHYPLGKTASHVMGGVDVDSHGIAGVEKYFDQRLTSDPTPLRLSIDARIQSVMRDELAATMDNFQAIGAAAVLMDVRTGELIAMVSLPDYDANDFGHLGAFVGADHDKRFNRVITGLYEPGSTFKLQTAAMALDSGVVHIWDRFCTIPIHVGRFKISDLKTDHFAPYLALPSVLAHSSNPAAAHIALDVGPERQQAWLRTLGFLDKVPVELPGAAHPIAPSPARWSAVSTMTIGFGHGVALSPLAIVRGLAAAGNGGILVKPTLLAHDTLPDDNTVPEGPRVMQPSTSDMLRRILRLDVTHGTGRRGESVGYLVGGKTGTAEKIGANGRYLKHVNITAFTGMFPMNAPRYALYVMLDAPHGTAATHGYTTAGWIAAPLFSQMVRRVAPMLGMLPETPEHAAQLDAKLSLPLDPTPPRGTRPLGPGNDPGLAWLNRGGHPKRHPTKEGAKGSRKTP